MDDSDEELGAYIYSTSRTAKLFREEAAATNNISSTNHNKSNNICATSRSKRNEPPEGDDVVSAVLPNAKVARKRCSNEGCTNLVVN